MWDIVNNYSFWAGLFLGVNIGVLIMGVFNYVDDNGSEGEF